MDRLLEGYLPIADHGVIGNLSTVALVGRNASIDWCCLPSLDSPSVFGGLLDRRRGGCFQVHPPDTAEAVQRYLPGTSVLETTFRTPGGSLTVTDFMPLSGSIHGCQNSGRPEIWRLVRCVEGAVDVHVQWSPRSDYARAPTRITLAPRGAWARSGGESLSLEGIPPGAAVVVEDASGPTVRARIHLRAREQLALVSRYGTEHGGSEVGACEAALGETIRALREWVHTCAPEGECSFAGPLHERVVRSGLVLKLLTHRHTGAIAAAPTTSLPEEIGGVRNWDYRFSWLRDSSLVSQALAALGHQREARDFLRWVERVSKATDDEGYSLQIMYGLHGERNLPEVVLEHLEGYRGSRPVRIGNGAAGQRQLDVYGELMNAAYELARIEGEIHPRMWSFLSAVADHACDAGREPDQGIWEVRTAPQHFVFSKVMVWVALDRAIRLAELHKLPARTGRWRREREAIRRAVLSEGFDPELGAFVRAFGSAELDAANLLIPVVEFLPPEDPRVQGTIDRTLEQLTHNGMVYRYTAEDGLPGGEGAFGLCSFWMTDALTLSGRLGEAREIFHGMVERANHLGLYAEEINAETGEFLGNFPQAFSHVGFINSALYLARAEGRPAPAPAPMGSRAHSAQTGHATRAAV